MAAPHTLPLIDQAKRDLRTRQRALRRPLSIGELTGLEHQLDNAIALLPTAPMAGRTIAGFLPIGTEPDLTRPLMRLHEAGMRVLLPETPFAPGPLVFRLWEPGVSMRVGRFGTLVPDGPPSVPEVVLVPLLAFDPARHRLGYGGGFYDRTLAALPAARTIGVAADVLRVDKVPVGPHDLPLDMVATETRLWR